jgi:AraC-like DNA-binding protein
MEVLIITPISVAAASAVVVPATATLLAASCRRLRRLQNARQALCLSMWLLERRAGRAQADVRRVWY